MCLLDFWRRAPTETWAMLRRLCAFLRLRYWCAQYLLDNNMNEMEYFADPKWGVDPEALNRLKLVASSTFERCSYTKAIAILKEALAKVITCIICLCYLGSTSLGLRLD
jgi:hypothetical protein